MYFDHLLILDELESLIKKYASSPEEKEELWSLIDEIIHHKAMDFVLTRLDRKHHEEFVEIFHKCPHDEITVFSYLKKKAHPDIEKLMKDEFSKITDEIKELLR